MSSLRTRVLTILALIISSAGFAQAADSLTVTSGAILMSWDGSTSGIDLIGSGTHLTAEDTSTPPSGAHAGDSEDLSRTIATSNMNHPVSVTVNGRTYPSVWVKGQFTITATPFTVPDEPVNTSHVFSTPFTMSGQFAGYTDQQMTSQAFTASLTGSGVANIGPMRVVSEHTYLMSSGGLTYQFTGPLPTSWSSSDIGVTGRSGVASFDSGTYYVSGAGSDVWGTTDSFHFVSQTLDGDGQIVARVSSISDTNMFAKGGIMLRDSLSADASEIILDLLPANGIEFMTRAHDGGTTAYLGGDTQAPPAWLQLIRTGSTVTAAVSADGESWRAVGSTSFAATGAIFAGLAVTSHDTAQLNTSSFDNVSVRATASTSGGPTDIVIYASDIPASGHHGTWAAVADPTAASGVKLSTPDDGVSNTAEPLAVPSDYVDVTFTAVAGTPYTIWLRLQAAANSKWNDSAWVQFSAAQASGSDERAVNQIGTQQGLLVNLATDSAASSLNGWGWQNTAYWLTQPTTVTFAASGPQTLRIQVREDGVQFDQIVLSPATYLRTAPGPVGGDHTIVRK